MTRRRGEITKRQIVRDWPHHVRLLTPEYGWGQRLNDLYAFCRDRDMMTAADRGPGRPDASLWCFRSADDADAFLVFIDSFAPEALLP